ncbi:MAG: cation diffusion facilitator family transporter [Spirochaetota bacterium]
MAKHTSGEHDHAGGRIATAFFLNLFFSLFEIVGGILTGSTAILSDAVHDLGDAVSLGISWKVESYSRKHRDTTYTFGYRRFSLLGSLLSAVVLLIGISIVLTRAIPALFNPPDVHAGGMLLFAIVGITVNLLAVLKLHEGHSSHEKMVTLHLLEDVFGWAGVLIVSIILQFVYLPILDPLLAVVISAFLIITIVRQVRQVLVILLQAAPEHLNSDEMSKEITRQFPQASGIHDMHIWSLDDEHKIMSFHMILDDEINMAESAQLKTEIKQFLSESYGIDHVTIDAETNTESCTSCD